MTIKADARIPTLIITIVFIISIGSAILFLPSIDINNLQQPDNDPATSAEQGPVAASPADPKQPPALIDPKTDSTGHAKQARELLIDQHFQRAVIMLHAEKYEYALIALHRVLALAPKMPEAHVNMGYTLFGMKRYREARDFFVTAIELKPGQLNAYYGLAESLEAIGDLQGALSAMASFVHLNKNKQDPFIRKAETAMWEWRDQIRKSRKQANEKRESADKPAPITSETQPPKQDT